jgi:hypothetical protein
MMNGGKDLAFLPVHESAVGQARLVAQQNEIYLHDRSDP